MDDTRAVSSVIGVILIVAVTVILAAVTSTLALGLVDNLKDTGPVAEISIADAPDNAPPPQKSTNGEVSNWAEISHNNGDIIDASDLKILIKDSSGTTVATLEQSNSYSHFATDGSGDTLELYSDSSRSSVVDTSSTLTAGETWYISVDNARYPAHELGFPDGQYTIVIVHTPSQSITAQSDVTIR